MNDTQIWQGIGSFVAARTNTQCPQFEREDAYFFFIISLCIFLFARRPRTNEFGPLSCHFMHKLLLQISLDSSYCNMENYKRDKIYLSKISTREREREKHALLTLRPIFDIVRVEFRLLSSSLKCLSFFRAVAPLSGDVCLLVLETARHHPWELESFYDATIRPFGFCLHIVETTELSEIFSYLRPDAAKRNIKRSCLKDFADKVGSSESSVRERERDSSF